MPALFSVAFRLGPLNVLRVIIYRASLRLRLHQTIYLKPSRRFTAESIFDRPGSSGVSVAENLGSYLESDFRWFGWLELDSTSPPNWHQSILKGGATLSADQPWWRTALPSTPNFDVKEIWEASRFGWAISMAQSARLGDEVALGRLNEWTEDWVKKNPPFFGPNWICAQECSLRLIHMAAASLIIGKNWQMSPALWELVHNHMLRIASTLSYAKGQQNNHLVSEAVALFIGGTWLIGNGHEEGHRFESIGRRLLGFAFPKLVYEDGEFAQHSSNYQRLVNDLLCFVEVWRLAAGSPPFTREFYEKGVAVNRFLSSLLDVATGRCPNMGGNDGAHILQICSTDYLDFRPSVEIGQAVFAEGDKAATAFAASYFQWLGVSNPSPLPGDRKSKGKRNDQRRVGGLDIISTESSKLYFRRPGYSFRPPNCDALHIDFWRKGVNVFRDAGTFSYGQPPEELLYFHGSSGHNVVQFDSHNQMLWVSRFLFAKWPRSEGHSLVSNLDSNEVGDAYRDYRGNVHARRAKLEPERLVIVDQISGKFQRAVLRWRLAKTAWVQDGSTLRSQLGVISVTSGGRPVSISLVDGKESLYYGRERTVPILEAAVESDSELITTFGFGR